MSKIRLVDVETKEEELLFGTCDYCFSSDWMEVTSYEFEYADGTHEVVPGAEVGGWGDELVQVPDFHVTRFAGWLEKQEFPEHYRIWCVEELIKLVERFESDTRGDE